MDPPHSGHTNENTSKIRAPSKYCSPPLQADAVSKTQGHAHRSGCATSSAAV